MSVHHSLPFLSFSTGNLLAFTQLFSTDPGSPTIKDEPVLPPPPPPHFYRWCMYISYISIALFPLSPRAPSMAREKVSASCPIPRGRTILFHYETLTACSVAVTRPSALRASAKSEKWNQTAHSRWHSWKHHSAFSAKRKPSPPILLCPEGATRRTASSVLRSDCFSVLTSHQALWNATTCQFAVS